MTKLLLLTSLITVGMLAQETTPDKRLQNARTSFEEIMASPDKGIPQDLLEKARCIIIVPGLIKGALPWVASMAAGSHPAGLRKDGHHRLPFG